MSFYLFAFVVASGVAIAIGAMIRRLVRARGANDAGNASDEDPETLAFHRALLRKRDWKETEPRALEEGQLVQGVVEEVTNLGVFVNLGGAEGLLHKLDMSWGRVGHPREMFRVGDAVTAKVLKLNPENRRASLGLKQLTEDPWNAAERKYPPGETVRGRVLEVANWGAVVEVEPGVEGILGVDAKVVAVGQRLECRVLEIDASMRRLMLERCA